MAALRNPNCSAIHLRGMDVARQIAHAIATRRKSPLGWLSVSDFPGSNPNRAQLSAKI